MNRVTVENSLKNRLLSFGAPVEMVDEAGRPLGHFVPRISMVPPDDCPYSVEQLDKMRSEIGGRSLAETWCTLATITVSSPGQETTNVH